MPCRSCFHRLKISHILIPKNENPQPHRYVQIGEIITSGLVASVGLGVEFVGRAFSRTLFRLILCGLLTRRDIMPARVGLRFVEFDEDESLVNRTLLHDPFVVILSLRLGLEVGDIGGLRLRIFSLELECGGLDVIGEMSSSEVF